MSFDIPIRIAAGGTSATISKVTAELDRVERAGKTAGEMVSKALAAGMIQANQAKAATALYVKELNNAERAANALGAKAEIARAKATGIGGAFEGIKASIASAFGGLPEVIGHLGLAGSAIGGMVGGLVSAGNALVGFHVAMLQMNDGLIMMRNRLRTVTDSQLELGFAMNNTKSLANRTLTDWKTTIDVYVRMANATRELGLTTDHTMRLTETLSKMFQTSGRSAGESSAAMLQLSQALGSGTLQGDEFRSLAENAPKLLEVFARQMGVTRGELKELGSEGKITTDIMIKGLDSMAAATDKSFASMERTYAQKVQPMLNELKGDPMKVNRAVSNPFAMMTEGFDILKTAPAEMVPGLTSLSNHFGLELNPKVSDFNKHVGTTTELASKIHDELARLSGHKFQAPDTRSFQQNLERLLLTSAKLADPNFHLNMQLRWIETFDKLSAVGRNFGGVLDSLVGGLPGAKKGAKAPKAPKGPHVDYRIGGSGDDGTSRTIVSNYAMRAASQRQHDDDVQRKMREIDKQYAKPDEGGPDLQKDIAAYDARMERTKDLTKKWFEETARQSEETAATIRDAFKNAFDSISAELIRMTETGKFNLSSLANTIKNQLLGSALGQISGGLSNWISPAAGTQVPGTGSGGGGGGGSTGTGDGGSSARTAPGAPPLRISVDAAGAITSAQGQESILNIVHKQHGAALAVRQRLRSRG